VQLTPELQAALTAAMEQGRTDDEKADSRSLEVFCACRFRDLLLDFSRDSYLLFFQFYTIGRAQAIKDPRCFFADVHAVSELSCFLPSVPSQRQRAE